MEDNSKPSKPKKKKVPTKSTSKPIEVKPVTIKKLDASNISSEQIRRLLKEVMMENVYESKIRSASEIEAMISTMEEFLRSFIVIGYDMKNEPLVVTSAKSQLDADALYTALARLFISINNNGGM